MNIYINNLSTAVQEQELRNLFEKFGSVALLQIRQGGWDHNYTRGFVVMASGGREAIAALNGYCLKERWISVEECADHDFIAAGASIQPNRGQLAV